MKSFFRVSASLFVLLGLVTTCSEAQPQIKRKKVLAIGETRGFHHDATSTALHMIYDLGQETGLWDTYIQTSSEFITKKKLGGNKRSL
ncbi:MAG: hypothetical protein NTW74_05750 [Acidobacteria bacterium]|nr:hypothetical protein [Acidobacteriota bacterium]